MWISISLKAQWPLLSTSFIMSSYWKNHGNSIFLRSSFWLAFLWLAKWGPGVFDPKSSGTDPSHSELQSETEGQKMVQKSVSRGLGSSKKTCTFQVSNLESQSDLFHKEDIWKDKYGSRKKRRKITNIGPGDHSTSHPDHRSSATNLRWGHPRVVAEQKNSLLFMSSLYVWRTAWMIMQNNANICTFMYHEKESSRM